MKTFLIPSLVAAGFTLSGTAKATVRSPDTGIDKSLSDLVLRFSQQHNFILSGHRSHSSHGSHASHRSSSGGGYVKPKPASPAPKPVKPSPTTRNTNSTPPSSILPSPPAAAKPKVLPGNSVKFLEIAKNVQLALTARGYYFGPIDGIIGPKSREAISKFQLNSNISVTGTITPQVLDALGIQAN